MYGNTHHFDHLTYAGVGVGDYVGEQDVLGKIGDSGNAMGKHLHYEITNKSNESMDPHDYMNKYGAFGGVQNQKIANVDTKAFDSYNRAEHQKIVSATDDGKFSSRMFMTVMSKVLELLTSISSSNNASYETLSAIIKILGKYSDSLPPDAKKELSAIDNIHEVLAGMVNADKYALAKHKSKERKLINSDIREVTDIMKQLAYE